MAGTPLAAFSAQLATAMQNPEVRAAIDAIPSRASEVTIPDLCEGFGIASLATPSGAVAGTAGPKR